jgi:hypothetical protein
MPTPENPLEILCDGFPEKPSSLKKKRHEASDISRIIDSSMWSSFKCQLVFRQDLSKTLAPFQAKLRCIQLFEVHVPVSEGPQDGVKQAVPFKLSAVILSPRTEYGCWINIHPFNKARHGFWKTRSGINICLLNSSQFATECCQCGISHRTDERLKLGDGLKRSTVSDNRTDFDGLHLVARKLAVIAARCFEIDHQPVIRSVVFGVNHVSAV